MSSIQSTDFTFPHIKAGIFQLLNEKIRAGSEAEYLAKLEQRAFFLHRHLLPTSWFKSLLKSMEHVLSQGNPLSFAHTMASSETFRVVLHGRNTAAPINLHRQPGRYGVRLVLSGKVRINNYVPMNPYAEIGEQIALRLSSQQKYAVGEASGYSPNAGNISALESLSDYCLLLCLQTPGTEINPGIEVMPVCLGNGDRHQVICNREQLHLV